MAKQQKTKKPMAQKTKKKADDYVVPLNQGPRKLKTPKTRFPRNIWPFKKRVKPPRVEHHPVPSAFLILWNSLRVLIDHWRLFVSMAIIYALLELIFVRAFALTLELSTVKSDLSGLLHGHLSHIFGSIGQLFSLLIGTSNSSASAAGVWQSMLVVIGSLAIVWSLRQVHAGIEIKPKDGWYKGTYPLVPVLLILITIAVELLPFVAGISLGIIVDGGGIAVNLFEKIIGGILAVGISSISIYWLCSSLFALYIVSLPDVTPMAALGAAKDLVHYRRLIVLRKIVFLPIVFFIVVGIIMTPIILFITPVASWVFFLLTVIILPIVHSYMYTTYRELL